MLISLFLMNNIIMIVIVIIITIIKNLKTDFNF